jgi:hypothetical protein
VTSRRPKHDRGTDQIVTAHHAEPKGMPPHGSVMAMQSGNNVVGLAQRQRHDAEAV